MGPVANESQMDIASLRIHGVRGLPPGSVSGPLRVQATINGERRETGPSVWRKGSKTKEAVWLKGPSSTLQWRLSSSEVQRLKASAPRFKLYLHTGEEVLAWCMLDVRELVGGALALPQWVKLQGTASGEIRVSGGSRLTGGGARGDLEHGAARERINGTDAFCIGGGSELFVLSIEITEWGGDGTGLQLPGPGAGGMWISYIFLGSLGRTDSFDMLGKPPRPRRVVDMFRLKSKGDGSDLAKWFGSDANRYLDVYLCTTNRLVAVARVDLFDLLLGQKDPANVAADLEWFPHEASGRFQMESWEGDGSPGIKGGAWVAMKLRIEREEHVGMRAEALLTDGGSEKEGFSVGDLPFDQGPPEDDSLIEHGQSQEGSVGDGEDLGFEPPRIMTARGGDDGGGGDEGYYSDDFGSEAGGGGKGEPRDAEEVTRDDQEAAAPSGDGPAAHPAREQAAEGSAVKTEKEEGEGVNERTGDRGGQMGELDDHDDEEEEHGDGALRDDEGGGVGEAEHKPGGPRKFRLSVDLKSVRELRNPQHLFLFYHYPYLAPHVGPSVLDNPVLTAPVWAPARIETSMARSCCSFSFVGTYEELRKVGKEHPFVVSVRAKEGGGGAGTELGKASLPLLEVIESDPVNYRSPLQPRVFRTYQRCRRHLQRLAARGLAPADAEPVRMHAADVYAPIVGKDVMGDEASAVVPSMRVVLVLEDLGNAGTGKQASTSQPRHAAQSPAEPSAPSVSVQAPVPPEPPAQPGGVASGLAAPDIAAALNVLEVERKRIEFEEWRHRQEIEWVDRLRAKEAARMEELERLYIEKEKERKALFAKAQEDFTKLESKLRKSLAEVEARERRISAYEDELKAEEVKRTQDVQALQRRLREDARHHVDLERMRVRELEGTVARLEKALHASDAKCNEVQEEFNKYRKEQRKAPASALHAEIAKLKGEKAELEARWERERAEKNKALLEKEQYRSALQRTARALKREQGRHLVNLRQELEQLKIEYVAREERFQLDGQRQELHKFKSELDALRHISMSMYNVGGNQGAVPPAGRPSPQAHAQSGCNKENVTSDGFPSHWLKSSSPLSTAAEGRGGGDGSGIHRGLGLAGRDSGGVDAMDMMSPDASPVRNRAGEGSATDDPQLLRLRGERDDLLATGLYSVSDSLIKELSSLIEEKEASLACGPPLDMPSAALSPIAPVTDVTGDRS